MYRMRMLLPAIMICLSGGCIHHKKVAQTGIVKPSLLGKSVYIQIFKEERILELYRKLQTQDQYQLVKRYQICEFSGGLGPKYREGDRRSPEGFYRIEPAQLKYNSQFYRAINIGFPNDYDKARGYTGHSLMIHGGCKSEGCYAMTDSYIDEIFRYVETAFISGQDSIAISIYPFRMTASNMQRNRYSLYYDFWLQLEPGYASFTAKQVPPAVSVVNGQYVVHR